MKKNQLTLVFVLALVANLLYAQSGLQPDLQYYRQPGQNGLNVFEEPKEDTVAFEGVKVRVGGDFAMQFQGINHSTGSASDTLVTLGTNFNLPTANLNFDVQMHDGVRLHLRTYLSSRHHPEAWVKGGHIQVDKLNFISDGFMEGIMDVVTFKIGLDEINYGDAHFRRTDNARAIYNPFSGNYIMDSFTTEAFGEVYARKNGWLGMLALSNGKMNQSVVKSPGADNKISFYGKLGYDNMLKEDLRFRLTGSWYINQGNTRSFIYGGDRAGARYYNVMQTIDGNASSNSGRFNPGFNQLTAIQVNPFVKYKGLEFFGIYELALGGEAEGNGKFTQIGTELLYRFGAEEKVYLGGRYNLVTGKQTETSDNLNINRINVGGGWYLTENILTKLEYVHQVYGGDGWNGSVFENGKFGGIMLEAVIAF